MPVTPSAGDMLRSWRRQRRMTQRDLADRAGISERDLGRIEADGTVSGATLLLLAERLDMPLAARNALLRAAGYPRPFPQRPLADPALIPVRRQLEAMLAALAPCPAMLVDRAWTIISTNPALDRLIAGADPLLLQPPVNALRVWLHPAGLAPRIANLQEWREQMTNRLRHQIEVTGDPALNDLLEEIEDYPLPRTTSPARRALGSGAPVVPCELITIDGPLTFCLTSTTLTAPLDIALADLRIEAFHPLDAETIRILRAAPLSAPV